MPSVASACAPFVAGDWKDIRRLRVYVGILGKRKLTSDVQFDKIKPWEEQGRTEPWPLSLHRHFKTRWFNCNPALFLVQLLRGTAVEFRALK
jgi:hypothetical protein